MKRAALSIAGLLLGLVTLAFPAAAQQEVMPRGVGVYAIGFRQYAPQSKVYNGEGEKESLGGEFSREFNGRSLLEGAGGDDLKKLAEQLRKFDANSNSSDSLINTLRLGDLDVDVKGEVNAQAFGVGYGMNQLVTGFFIIPWVKAAVDVDINYKNNNNINVVRQRLGDLAFEELKAGFDKAATIDTAQIVDSITNLGYEDPHHWDYTGLGDIMVGGVFSAENKMLRRLSLFNTWRTVLSLPTGHYDDPDILNDVSVGKGYYQLINQYAPSLVVGSVWKFNATLSYGYGVPTKVDKRVPEKNEGLVAPDRKVAVNLKPGSDLGYNAGFSYIVWPVKPGYLIGVSRHLSDSYSGSLAGNYDKLSRGSDTYELYHEPSIGFETVKLYQQRRFAVPLVALLRAHIPMAARNTLDNRYIEMAVGSFFLTPYASTNAPKPTFVKSKRRQQRALATSKAKPRPAKNISH